MFQAYSILLYIFSIFFFPYMAVKMALKGKGRAGLKQRLGFFEDGFRLPGAGKTVWVHAVSVGETLAAVPVVKSLMERNPDVTVYFSTVTETGNAVAREKLDASVRVFFYPFDFAGAVKRAVEAIRPDVFVVVETEIWPNLLNELDRKNIPALMVNGRISLRSFKGYRRARFFMRRVLSLLTHLNMQTAQDAERIKALGAPPGRVSVSGNVKFDQACCGTGRDGVRDLVVKARLGVPDESLVMVAGSTHEGEEQEVLKAYRLLLAEFPGAFLVLAPRHPERLASVRALLDKEGVGYRLKSDLTGERLAGPDVIILDTMGELAGIYRVGDINFVGGSWVPVGGHNILEPAAFGKPVFFGPHMHNFAEISSILKDCGVGMEVTDGAELAREAARLMREPERIEAIAKAAKEALIRNRGALEKNVELIEKYLYRASS